MRALYHHQFGAVKTLSNKTLRLIILAIAGVFIMSQVMFLLRPTEAATNTYFQGFESDTSGWFDSSNSGYGSIERVSSGTSGITSAQGSWHALAEGDGSSAPFTRFDGYRDTWTGDWQSNINVYLDPSWDLGTGFDYSVASSGSDGAHQRDYIFHVTRDSSTGKLLVAGSNNTNFAPREDLESINNYEVTSAGWYIIQHKFYDDGGSLSVDLNLLDSDGNVLFTETRSNVADTIPAEVGGNRYGWFTFINVDGGIAIDDTELIIPPDGPIELPYCLTTPFDNKPDKTTETCVIAVDCEVVTVGADRELSNIIVLYDDGTYVKYEDGEDFDDVFEFGIPQNDEHGSVIEVWIHAGNNHYPDDPDPEEYNDGNSVGRYHEVPVPECEEPEPIEPCSVSILSNADVMFTEGENQAANAKVLSWEHPQWISDSTEDPGKWMGAEWIWGDDPVSDANSETIQNFTREFNWNGSVNSAVIDIAADNDYELYVNGNHVGNGSNTFGGENQWDVKDFMVDGLNTLEVVVTNWEWPTADPKVNPAGLLFKLVVTSDEGCDNPVVVESEITLCKLDDQRNPLAGWTLMLLGDKVEDLVVPVNTSAGANTTAVLNADKSYVAIAEGSWENRRSPLNLVDAEYSTEDTWATHMDGFTGFGTDILELQINSTFDPDSNWGAYNSAHKYAQSFSMSSDGNANFRIYDGNPVPTVNDSWYGDNAGQLNVEVYEGYAGVTGDNGCVTFEDVTQGEYDVDEILLDGWENVSGLGNVSVNGDNTLFVVNSEVPEERQTALLGRIGGLVFEDIDGDGIQDLEDEVMDDINVYLFSENSPLTLASIQNTDDITGNYLFDELEVPGAYWVCQQVPEGFLQTLKEAAGEEGVEIGDLEIGQLFGDTDNPDTLALLEDFCYRVFLTMEDYESLGNNFGNFRTAQLLGDTDTRDPSDDGEVLAATGQAAWLLTVLGTAIIAIALASTRLARKKRATS